MWHWIAIAGFLFAALMIRALCGAAALADHEEQILADEIRKRSEKASRPGRPYIREHH